MQDDHAKTISIIMKEKEKKMSGLHSTDQKQRRSTAAVHTMAIASKTSPSRNIQNIDLNQGVVIKSEPNLITMAPMTNQIPNEHSNKLMSNFDQYHVTGKSSLENPDIVSVKHMKLSPTQYMLVQNKNIDTSNSVFTTDMDNKALESKDCLREFALIKKNLHDTDNMTNQYGATEEVNLVDCNNMSNMTLTLNNSHEISLVPNLPTTKNNVNQTTCISSVQTSVAKNFTVNKELEIIAPKLNSTVNTSNVPKIISSSQKSKFQKPVVIMQQLLSPAQKTTSLKSKQIFLQNLNKLLPLNIQNIKVEMKMSPESTSQPTSNEAFNDELKIINADTTKNIVKLKNEIILKTEEFPTISNSQIDLVLKAIDVQNPNKEFLSNEADTYTTKSREYDGMRSSCLPLSYQEAAKCMGDLENSQYMNIVVNAPSRLQLIDQPQNQKSTKISDQLLEKYIDHLLYYKCKKCLYMSLNSKLMLDHIKREHSNVAKQHEQPILKCPGCTNTFHYRTSLLSHIVHDHQVHESEARVMIQTLCHGKESVDENNDPKPMSHVQMTKVQNVLQNQISDTISDDYRCIGNISHSHLQTNLNINTMNPNVQTLLKNNLIVDCNADQYSENVNNIPIVIASSVEAEKLQDIQILGDVKMLPLKSDSQIINSEVLELTDTDICKNVPDEKSSEQHFEFINFKNESQNEEECYLRENQILECTVSNEGIELRNILESKQKQENIKLTPKNDDIKKKGNPKESKTSPSEQNSIELKQLGYKCNVETCNVHMLAQENILYHQKCHVGSIDKGDIHYQCPECSEFMSNNWNNIASHLWRSHIIDMELYTCDLCSYKTPSLSNLMNQHRGIHENDRLYLCDNCGKGFKTAKQLRNHIALHKVKNKQPLECDECRRVFTSMRLVKLHKDSVHKDSKPFMCNFCTYSASTRSALKLHLRRHTGEKPFSCEQCTYSTGDHNSIRRHKLRHLGLKPYSCPHCSYACIQSSTYKVHLKNKHPGLDHGLMFSCQYCSYRSVKKENLLTHIAKHKQGSLKSVENPDSPVIHS